MSITIHTIDLNFLGTPGTIAAYLILHEKGGLLVESGPGSTIPGLVSGLATHNLKPGDITDVFLTHIHLDHAGAAGWLARQGARIHVHENGARHMLDPTKLLNSAQRIYGDQMDLLWGEFLPVSEHKLSVLQDGDVVNVSGLQVRAVSTPGHAEHHFAYIYEDVCFSGDIGGVRVGNLRHLRLPMPPPEFHLEKWRASLECLKAENFKRIAPTHFGIYTDREWHLTAIETELSRIDEWLTSVMPEDPSIEKLNAAFLDWAESRSLQDGLNDAQIHLFETANPSWMSSYGIQRYWRKYRQPTP